MRPLGKTQRAVLHSLKSHKDGKWHENIGWIWDTPSGTLRVMVSLTRRGLVWVAKEEIWLHGRKAHRDVFTITDAGREVATYGR